MRRSIGGRAGDDEFQSVLGAARAGRGEAFDDLFRRYRRGVAAFLAGRGVVDVDDVASETFLAVFRSLGRFEGSEADFRAWLYRIARNKAVDWFRARGRRPETVAFPHGFDREGGDVEDDAARSLGRAELVRLFGDLTDDQAEVLLLRAVGDLTIAQIAEVMGRSSGAIKAHQRRGLERLRARIEADDRLDGTTTSTPPGATER